MAIPMSDEKRAELLGRIRTWFREELDEDFGELRARLVLDFFMERLAPPVYNQAIRDAQTRLQDKVLDLEGELSQPE